MALLWRFMTQVWRFYDTIVTLHYTSTTFLWHYCDASFYKCDVSMTLLWRFKTQVWRFYDTIWNFYDTNVTLVGQDFPMTQMWNKCCTGARTSGLAQSTKEMESVCTSTSFSCWYNQSIQLKSLLLVFTWRHDSHVGVLLTKEFCINSFAWDTNMVICLLSFVSLGTVWKSRIYHNRKFYWARWRILIPVLPVGRCLESQRIQLRSYLSNRKFYWTRWWILIKIRLLFMKPLEKFTVCQYIFLLSFCKLPLKTEIQLHQSSQHFPYIFDYY